MDVDSMSPGENFVQVLEGWVQQCDVLLALIGEGWATASDPKTKLTRLNNPKDFVRTEIRGALNRTIPVVPVLLDGTPMPEEDQLPDDMKGLLIRQAEFIDYRTFDSDVQRLIKKLIKRTPIDEPASEGSSASHKRARFVLAGLLVALLLGASGYILGTAYMNPPLAPPAAQTCVTDPDLDCRTTQIKADQLICANEALCAKETKMNNLYKKLKESLPGDKRTQMTNLWKQRSLCTDIDCVENFLDRELQTLINN
jgi:hypothetical protein